MSSLAPPAATTVDANGQDARAIARAAKTASRTLSTLTETARNQALGAMADAVAGAGKALLEANAEDLQTAERLSGDQALPPSTRARLRLTEGKLHEMVEGIRAVVALPDPLNRVLEATELDDANPANTTVGSAAANARETPRPGL